ncbi:GNAT family N-acetyltransferase [Paenilisteria rocourtiae]|uniref:Ribosomal-protein-alanine N-acetyltransferase n=1 Tax=Listeria rocourtiae TaxID=647910 RepID=A0A4R6ZL71_9LIST|nr:GNAT family protein [Listeria rocourtiae]EUJ50970.1 putative N-acetyltransferase [Listeria rocourtiae FSL F6-920]MBC1433747.1 GNAT family N-acetyltransferase [Listeria rocourtiae]MBC1604287.1 GNAT family N-acetyltransferase [Listeria rocourtiae]TDR52844.1 ribosomal-protein-alanine N-acetyltransferase [Listeria rocourtiae]
MESFTYLLVEHQLIKTERLILRPITLADAKDMFEYASDDDNTRFVFDTHPTIEITRQKIAEFFVATPTGKYGIEIATTGKFIGTIDIRIDPMNRSGCLGYALNKDYWGHGYMTEAGFAILDLAFQTLQLERVFAMHDVRNPASGKVMQRLGMTYEGTIRKSRYVKEEFVDDAYYSILKEEYKAK